LWLQRRCALSHQPGSNSDHRACSTVQLSLLKLLLKYEIWQKGCSVPLIVLARICQFNLTTSFEKSTRPKVTALQACQILFRLSDRIMTCFGVCMSLRQATLPAQSTSHLDRSPCHPSTSGRSHTDSRPWRNCRSDNPAHLTQRRFAALGRRSRNFGTSLNAASEGKQVWLSVGCCPHRYV